MELNSVLMPSRARALASKPGSRPNFPALKPDVAVALKKEADEGGMYGIGMKIDLKAPHRVMRVSNLKDPDGNSANNSVKVGDALSAVDGNEAKVANMESVEKLIFGKKDTIITLTFASKEDGRTYDVALRRHIPIQTWDSDLQWYEVKEEHRGSNLMALPDIVKSMDEVRRLLVDKHGLYADLLRRDKDLRQGTAVGIVLPKVGAASPYEPTQIEDMIQGSPAHLSGQLHKGDTILSVDGVEINERNLADRLHGCDVVGSPCKLGIYRNGTQHTVQIARASHSSVERIQEVTAFVSTVKNKIKENASPETLQHALDEVLAKLLHNEKERQAEEEVMAHKIHALQTKILEHLSASMAKLYPSKEKESKELSELADNLNAQLARLQEELADANRRKDELSRQVTDLSKENSDAADRLVANSKLLEDLERQKSMTVQKSDLKAALDDAKRAETELALLQQKMSGLVDKGDLDTAKHTIASLEAQLAKLKERMDERVPRSEVEDKRKEIQNLQSELDRLKSVLSQMVPLSQLQNMQEQLAAALAQLEQGESAKGRMVSSDALTDANKEIGRLQAELEQVRAEMKRMVPSGDAERLEEQLGRAKADAARHRALLQGMVPAQHVAEASAENEALKAALEKMRRHGADRVAKSELDGANDRLERLAEELRKTKALLHTKEHDVEELKRAMANMVARSELLEAQAAAKQAQSELDAMRDEVTALEAAKAQWKAKADGYQAQVEDLAGKMGEMIDKNDYYKALADAKGSKEGLDTHKTEVKALNERLQAHKDAIAVLKAELDKCKSQMADMVPRSELNAALAEARRCKEEAESRRKEAELLSSQLADVKGKLKTAKEEGERRQSQLGDMVPREELLKARAEAKSKAADIESKQSQISDWKKANGALEEQVKGLKEEAGRLERALKGKVDQNEVLAAHKEASSLRDQLAEKSKELRAQEGKVAEGKKELARAEEEIAGLKKQLASLVPRKDYLDEKSKAESAREEADARELEVKGLQEQLRALKSELMAAKSERDGLQLRLNDSAPRADLADAKRDAALLRDQVFALEKEVGAVKEQREALKAQLAKAKEELDKLSAQMGNMADKAVLTAARTEAKQATDGLASIQKQLKLAEEEKAERSKQMRELKEKLDKLEQLLLDSVPRKDYLKAQEDAKRARDELEVTRKDNEAMQKSIEKLREELAANSRLMEELQNKMADMVSRDAFLKAQAEARDSRHEAQRVSAELEQLKSELAQLRSKLESAATKADYDAAQAAGRRAEEELEGLRRKLAGAGLADQALLHRLLAALKGPPPLDPARVARLLEVIRGSSAVSLDETLQMVEKMGSEGALLRPMDVVFLMGVMQGPPPRSIQDLRRLLAALGSMSIDDAVRLLALCRGPPPLSVADLDAMLQHCPSLADLERLKAELAGLRKKVAEQAAALEEQAAGLAASSAKVCPAPSEHEEMRRLRAAPPVVHAEGGEFMDCTTVHVSAAGPLCTLFVTTDGSDPSPSNFASKGPVIALEVDESCMVKAAASHDGTSVSQVAWAELIKAKPKKKAPAPAPVAAARAAPPPPPPPKAAGVGLLIERFDGSTDVKVKEVVGSGPAAACGQILAGDSLVAVGEASVAGLAMPQIYAAIEGHAGTSVALTLRHRAGNTQYSVTLVREFPDVDSLNERLAAAAEASRKTPPPPPPVPGPPPKAGGSSSLFPDKPPDGSVFLNMLSHKSYSNGASGS